MAYPCIGISRLQTNSTFRVVPIHATTTCELRVTGQLHDPAADSHVEFQHRSVARTRDLPLSIVSIAASK